MTAQLWFSLWAGVAIKGAAVLTAAWASTALLRKRSAALRHLVWTAAFAVMILLPAGMATLPSFSVPSASPLRVLDPADAIPALQPGPPASEALIRAPQPKPKAAMDWRGVALLIWAAGTIFALARIAIALVALRRLRRAARSLPEEIFADVLEIALLRRRVRLMETGNLVMPMSWGFRHPTIFLPIEARQWDSDRLRSVLLHELFHIQRRDVELQMVANLACAFYWYNPLAWIGLRRFLAERECATDDLVLSAGVRAASYAEDLLHIASAMRPADAHACLTVGMARRSQIESRVRAILDQRVHRTAARAAAVLVVVAAAVVLAVVSVRTHRPLPSMWRGWNFVHDVEPSPWAVELEGRWPRYIMPPAPSGCGLGFFLQGTPKLIAQACDDQNGTVRLSVGLRDPSTQPGRPGFQNSAESTVPRGETVTLAEGENWGPIRARLVPNRIPHQMDFRFASKSPSVQVEGIEEYWLQYIVTVRNLSHHAVTYLTLGIREFGNDEVRSGSSMWRSPPDVAIRPESTTRFSVMKKSWWAMLPPPPERASTDPLVTVHGASFSDGSFEGSDPEVESVQVQYEARKLQGRMVVAELRRIMGSGGVVTESKINLANSRTPQVTQTAVEARLAHPDLASGETIAFAAPNGRQDVMGMLKWCANLGRNPDDARRCVTDLEQEYKRH